MTISIRPATVDDLPTLVGFNQAMAAETEDKGLNVTKLTAGIDYLLNHPAEGLAYVAVAERVIGSMFVTFEWSDWRNGRFWWIQSVFVAASHRRQGVYTKLHERVRKDAREDSQSCGLRLYVESENRGAQETYRQMGMHRTHYQLFEEEFKS